MSAQAGSTSGGVEWNVESEIKIRLKNLIDYLENNRIRVVDTIREVEMRVKNSRDRNRLICGLLILD